MGKFERLRTTPGRAVAPLLRLQVERTTRSREDEISHVPFISRGEGLHETRLIARNALVTRPNGSSLRN